MNEIWCWTLLIFVGVDNVPIFSISKPFSSLFFFCFGLRNSMFGFVSCWFSHVLYNKLTILLNWTQKKIVFFYKIWFPSLMGYNTKQKQQQFQWTGPMKRNARSIIAHAKNISTKWFCKTWNSIDTTQDAMWFFFLFCSAEGLVDVVGVKS